MNNEKDQPTEISETAPSSERRSFMKTLMTGAAAAGGLAAVSMVQTTNAAGGNCASPFTGDELKQLTNAIQAYGGRVVDYFPCGIPAPDSVWGTASVRPEAAGAMIQALLKLDRFRLRLEVFPYGIPYPDLVNVQFRTPGTPRSL